MARAHDPPAGESPSGEAPSAEAVALQNRLTVWLARQYDRPVTVAGLTRLAGGVSRDTWAFDVVAGVGEDGELGAQRHPMVLCMDIPSPFFESERAAEAALIGLAGRRGVPVPRALWSVQDPAVLGAPFLVMERLEGESRITRLHRDARFNRARAVLPIQMAEVLAKIHRIAPEMDPEAQTQLRRLPQAQAVAYLDELYRTRALEPHPVLELGLRWLEAHLPPESPLALVHGDFRPGNMLCDETGLVAVLDWELAYWGDPLMDVAWVALRSWRGGVDGQEVGGMTSRSDFHRAYEEAGGRSVPPGLIRFWDIFALVRWAIVTMMQARGNLDGLPNIELAAMGRRTAEIEWDLLTALEREG